MTEIQRADPSARRIAIACAIVGTLIGSVALMLLHAYRQSLLSWLAEASPRTQVGIASVALVVLCAPMFLVAAWMWRYGSRVLRGSRHPPEGLRTVRDTPVAHGAAARRLGRLLQSLAVLLALSILFTLWMAWGMLHLR